MKIKILIIILISFSFFGTTYHVRKSGNDTNDGSSGSPWLTLGKAETTVAAGDSVIIGIGTYAEALLISTSGTSGNIIAWIDSVYFTDGVPAVVDTTWGVKVDGSGLAEALHLQPDNFNSFMHIEFFGADGDVVKMTAADNNRITHCLLRGHGDGSGQLFSLAGSSETDTLDYNLLLGDNSVNSAIVMTPSAGAGLSVFDHNTIHGTFITQAVKLQDAVAAITFTNNIVETTSTDDIGIELQDGDFLADTKFDFNITHAVTTSKRYTFTPGAPSTDISSVTIWADSLQTVVSGTNADNSLGQDPLLLNKATTCTIDATSPAEGAASGGLDMGYYQFTAAATRNRFIDIF